MVQMMLLLLLSSTTIALLPSGRRCASDHQNLPDHMC